MIGLLKIVEDGKPRTRTSSFTELRRKKMIKKIVGVICWPWTKFIKWLAKGLPEKKDGK